MKLIFMNIIILFIKEEKIKEEDNRHCFKSLPQNLYLASCVCVNK